MKKLIAVAVLGALAAPAFADSGNVTISGTIRAAYVRVNAEANDATDASADHAAQNKIEGRYTVTLAGTEDLGNGLSTVWGITTRKVIDSGSDTTTSGNGLLGGKEAYLGLKGNFGQVRLGHDLDNYNDGKHNGFVILGGEFFGRTDLTDESETNAARYDLPAFGNLTSSVRINLGENKTTGHAADLGYTLRADYDTESWDIGAAYNRQSDKASSAPSATKVTQYNLTGAYRFGNGLELAGEYERTKTNADGAKALKEYTLYLNYTTGKWGFGGEYGRAKQDTSKTKLWGAYAHYSLSKRTAVAVEYTSQKGNGSEDHSKNIFLVGLNHTF